MKMRDLITSNFIIYALQDVILEDIYKGDYNGEYEAKKASFIIRNKNEQKSGIAIFTNINYNFEEFEISSNDDTPISDLLNLVEEKKEWFENIILFKIDNPRYNGYL